MTDTTSALKSLAENAKAWPFQEAKKLLKRLEKNPKEGPVIFETGYGPSGLPHIGTFGEVARTSMVRHAFHVLTDDKIPSKLIAFSDDMDGMRKVPGNVPKQEMLQEFIDIPLSRVPNPFEGDYPSFAHHNNAKLCAFLDAFGFDYKFASATEYYTSGRFDAMLIRAAERFDDIMKVMLPTLGAERQATYSPFLPVSPKTGKVLYVPMKEVNAKDGTLTFEDEGQDVTISLTGGNAKLQWKPDFGMRWAALGVDFEMYGKDHQTNSTIYDRICRILGAPPPEHFIYELFLDEKGEKISKTKGNGIAIEDWLTYASPESLSLYMFQKPKTAKRLYFDVIPKAVDEYYSFLSSSHSQEPEKKIENPAWHIHAGMPPSGNLPVSFAMLLNLVSASNATDESVLWGFIQRYEPTASAENNPDLDRLIGYAVRYFHDFVLPTKSFRAPSALERTAIDDLASRLREMPAGSTAEDFQDAVYAVGKEHPFENLRDWFKALYQVLLGQDQGPRFGSFIALYGRDETLELIERSLKGEHLTAA
ncbi:MAG: lysine--tRNA ligase [Pseudomonadota bacterium]